MGFSKCKRCKSNSITFTADLRGTLFPSCLTCGYEDYSKNPWPNEKIDARLIRPGKKEVEDRLNYSKKHKRCLNYNKA